MKPKNWKRLLLASLILLASRAAFAQGTAPAGFIHNPDSAAAVPLDPFFLEDRQPGSPSANVLEKYPTPRLQGEIASCVAWAVVHARLIQVAYQQQHVMSLEEIDHINLSASYLYNQALVAPGNCLSGSLIPTTLRIAKQKGICPAAVFSNSRRKCEPRPGPTHDKAAMAYKIENYYNALDGKTSPKDRLNAIKRRIEKRIPVIVGLAITKNLSNIGSGDEWWHPDKALGFEENGHAFVVVAYNDLDRGGAITLMGSYGTDWGIGGFIKMRYTDFSEMLQEAYTLSIP